MVVFACHGDATVTTKIEPLSAIWPILATHPCPTVKKALFGRFYATVNALESCRFRPTGSFFAEHAVLTQIADKRRSTTETL